MTAPQNPFPPPPEPPSADSGGFSNAMLCGIAYLGLAFCLIPTLVVLAWQWQNKPVRFHGLQATAYALLGALFTSLFGPLAGLQTFILGDLLGGMLSLMTLTVVFLVYILIWVVMTYRVFTGHNWVIPVVGPWIQSKFC